MICGTCSWPSTVRAHRRRRGTRLRPPSGCSTYSPRADACPPREDLNSIAWLVWHIARAEDIFAQSGLAGRDQVFDDGLDEAPRRDRKDFGSA